jgi:phage tail sheath gpL-like
MKPLNSEDIIFINDENSSQRKGVTVSSIKTTNGEEIRVAIWSIISVEDGFLTPKSGGISLKINEFLKLIEKTPDIQKKIHNLSVSSLDDVFSSFNTDEGIQFLKNKIAVLEKSVKKSDVTDVFEESSTSTSTSSGKKKRKLDM